MKAIPTDRTIALQKLGTAPSSALFAGPHGSGRTQAAQEIASTLGVDLRRVDLSQLVSPNIGETEKRIDALFDAAARDGAVLVFDEADALFGKRTKVHDAHDRYANIEANYLLAKIEAHLGAAIVTTNRRENLDPAFVRRLGAVIAFHLPTDPHK
jgi:SpoVK/Ycf46/Vps4 family AAA+-type ATPase